MKRGKECFNIVQPAEYGPFSIDLEGNDSFFVNDKWSGMYASELLDIKFGNETPRFEKLIKRLC